MPEWQNTKGAARRSLFVSPSPLVFKGQTVIRPPVLLGSEREDPDCFLAGNPIRVFNHGQMQRDFTYTDDIVEGGTAML